MSWKIYLIKHLDTDMKYVGITRNDLIARWDQHRADTNSAVYKALRTEGYRMTMELLEEVATESEARKKERDYIQSFETMAPSGWNRQCAKRKEVKHVSGHSTSKMIVNSKQRSLITRKNDYKEWKYDSTIIYDNCTMDLSLINHDRSVKFNDDKGTKNGIWCRAPRPHILDLQFEVAMSDWYYLVSWNAYHFNPFKDKRRHPITYTIHRATWDDNLNHIQRYQYLGTFVADKSMYDFKKEVDIENYIIQCMRDYQRIVTLKVTYSQFGKVREVAS
jgi:hypothetical protein